MAHELEDLEDTGWGQALESLLATSMPSALTALGQEHVLGRDHKERHDGVNQEGLLVFTLVFSMCKLPLVGGSTADG